MTTALTMHCSWRFFSGGTKYYVQSLPCGIQSICVKEAMSYWLKLYKVAYLWPIDFYVFGC